MVYDFECEIINNKLIPIACELYVKSDDSDIFEIKHKNYCGEIVVDWFVGRVDYLNIQFKQSFKLNIPPQKETVIPPTTNCCYCKEQLEVDYLRGDNHLNTVFRIYAHNKCNLQAKITLVARFAYNSPYLDDHIIITKLAKKIKFKTLA